MTADRKIYFLKRANILLQQGEIEPAIEEYKKILEFEKDINIIMELGKIYLQQEDYDETYNLFLPIINENIENKKFDEAADFLRFIIVSNNSYLPALTKLAEIFKISGKTNNLIVLYESLLYVYEEKGMKEELRKTLEELIQLSNNPSGYEEQLAKLTGEEAKAAGKADIEIDFDAFELELDVTDMHKKNDGRFEDDDILLHSKDENVNTSPIYELEGEDSSKSLSAVLSEVDFYVNDGYFGDAEKLIDQLKQEYPGTKLLLAIIEKLKKTKMEALQQGDSASSSRRIDFEIEGSDTNGMELETELLPEPEGEPEPIKPEFESISKDLFDIEFSIAGESSSLQEFEDSKVGLKIEEEQLQGQAEIKTKKKEPDLEAVDYEIDMEEPAKTGDIPIEEIDDDLLIRSPSVSPGAKGKIPGDQISSIEELDLDSIMVGTADKKPGPDVDASFKEINHQESAFDSKEELLKDEDPFSDEEAYLEIEKNVDNELKSIKKFNQSKPSLTLPVEHHSKDKQQVMCTVFSPPLVKIGSKILVQVFAHLYEKSGEAQQMAKEFDADAKRRGAKSLHTAVPIGTELMFELKMKDAVIAEPIRTMIWNGYTESVAFDVKIPGNFTKNSKIGKVVISQNTVPIGMIIFKIKIQKIQDKIPTKPKPLPIGEAKIYKHAFVSYASEDRKEVLRRVQMLSLLKVDYFQDIIGLDPGERWEKKLYQKIDEADVFFLFWSNAARNSQWVRKEISYAIQRKQGIDENPPEIIPVIIEGPPAPAPPSELKHVHFNDKMIYFIADMGKGKSLYEFTV
jgi:tetratricopeptide (TPR) repeat protein